VSAPCPEISGEDGRPLSIIGVYPTRTEAYDRSLVVSAMEIPHWILRHEDGFALCVRPPHSGAVAAELARFEQEGAERYTTPPEPSAPYSLVSLYGCAWVMGGFYAIQVMSPGWWLDRGSASSRDIVHGAWWQAFTALTLHADLGHIGANLAAGLVYAAFLLPLLGSGWTWLFILLAGAGGNLVNAWAHSAQEHLSIGASTAVFSALGILVAAQCTLRTLALREVRLREFLLPVGAGLGLLAYLGVGDAETDYMAHLFGLLTGVPFGVLGISLRLGTRTPRWVQAGLAWLAVGILAISWRLAVTH
jgi:rhomboid protease GluP